MKISIITPSYNQGEFIRDTIESVLNQDYNNFEHIIIDGGSTDNSIEIIKSYPHIKWISEKDNGAAEAINKGFRIADGEIITWINSDDYYPSNIFKKISDIFESDKEVEFIYGNRNVVLPKENRILSEKTVIQDAKKLIHISADIVRQPCSFFTKRLLDRAGYLDESLKLVFDYDLFIRFFLITSPKYVDETLAFQRDYGNTLTRKNLKKQALEIFRVSRKYGARLTDPIMFNSVIKKLLFPGKF